jgi:hypothetical protein
LPACHLLNTTVFFYPLSTTQAGGGTVPLRFLALAGISLPDLNPPSRGVRAGSDHGNDRRRGRSPSPISEPDDSEDDDDDENGENLSEEEEAKEEEEIIDINDDDDDNDGSVELVSVSVSCLFLTVVLPVGELFVY